MARATIGASSATPSRSDDPAFPVESLPESSAAALQGVLDAAVEAGTFAGITSAVVVAGRGSWASASGSADGVPLTPDTRRPTHSSAKTIVAAQVLRLVEEGRLGLDERASGYLPSTLSFFDANGATIRQVLGMRSGIPDLNESDGFYPAEQAPTVTEVFRKLPEPTVAPGSELHYASTNYVLLGAIIEHALGRPLSKALRSGVLDRPRSRGDHLHGGRRAGRRRVGGRDHAGVVGTMGLRAVWGVRRLRGVAAGDDRLPR